jgi:hypothetical protein
MRSIRGKRPKLLHRQSSSQVAVYAVVETAVFSQRFWACSPLTDNAILQDVPSTVCKSGPALPSSGHPSLLFSLLCYLSFLAPSTPLSHVTCIIPPASHEECTNSWIQSFAGFFKRNFTFMSMWPRVLMKATRKILECKHIPPASWQVASLTDTLFVALQPSRETPPLS